MDESSNNQASGASLLLHTSEEDEIKCMIRLDFPTTNNEANYETLIVGLNLTRAIGVENMIVYCDS